MYHPIQPAVKATDKTSATAQKELKYLRRIHGAIDTLPDRCQGRAETLALAHQQVGGHIAGRQGSSCPNHAQCTGSTSVQMQSRLQFLLWTAVIDQTGVG